MADIDQERQNHIDDLYAQFTPDKDSNLHNDKIISNYTWAIFILEEAVTAFLMRADLAAILTISTAIEATLREKLDKTELATFRSMIEEAALPSDMQDRLHMLRKYRNQWAHQKSLAKKTDIQTNLHQIEDELEHMAFFALKCGFEIIYMDQPI